MKSKLPNKQPIVKDQKTKKYLPDQREFLDTTPLIIKAHSDKDYTLLPDHHSDPIVSNNIAYQEFDYTTECVLDDDDLF